MVFLKDLSTQWPWRNEDPPNLNDKEIYTQRVYDEDASKQWKIQICPPLPGFAYVGYRVIPYGYHSTPVTCSLVRGYSDKPLFKDTLTTTQYHKWTPLPYPLVKRACSIYEDEHELLIKHNVACSGKVELVAQRFDDLLEDDSGLSYAFVTNKVEYILTPNTQFYKPIPEALTYDKPTKILPPVQVLLNGWTDTDTYRVSVSLT